MSRAPAYQEYAGDELGRRLGLSLAADGATSRIERVMWSQSEDQCSLLDDDKFLAGILGVPVEEWMSLREEIFHGRNLFVQQDGRIFSVRLKDEALKQKRYRKLQATNSKLGVAERARRKSAGSRDGSPTGSPIGSPNGSPAGEARVTSSSLIPIPIPTSSKMKKEDVRFQLPKEPKRRILIT